MMGVVGINGLFLLVSAGILTTEKWEYEPLGQHIVLDTGQKIHVIEGMNNDTDAETIVLVHGASTSARDFTGSLLPALERTYRVVAIDRPGHGYSDRGEAGSMYSPEAQGQVILDTLDKMGIREPFILGHSWAGSVALATAIAEHETVKPKGVIVLAGVTHPFEKEDSGPTRAALNPFYGGWFRHFMLPMIGTAFIEPTVTKSFTPDAVPDGYFEMTGLGLSLRPDTYLYNARDRSNISDLLVEQSKKYGEIDIPVLSIAATGDHVVPPENHHARLLEDVPGARAVMVEGAGHSPHWTKTDLVSGAIEDFVSDSGDDFMMADETRDKGV